MPTTFIASYNGQAVETELDVSTAVDIVEFVAGTTDPGNTTNDDHAASNDSYFDSPGNSQNNPNSEEVNVNFCYKNMMYGVANLKWQYLNLHIQKDCFSWSGDNNIYKRLEGAERLWDFLLRYYEGHIDKDYTVYFHFIGHSHGGNVINQLTNIIKEENYATQSPTLNGKTLTFPKNWKIRSITYLSTPFFETIHQLQGDHFTDTCRIINVYNEFDFTQRFIASFSLKGELHHLVERFDETKCKNAMNVIKNIDLKVYYPLLGMKPEEEETIPIPSIPNTSPPPPDDEGWGAWFKRKAGEIKDKAVDKVKEEIEDIRETLEDFYERADLDQAEACDIWNQTINILGAIHDLIEEFIAGVNDTCDAACVLCAEKEELIRLLKELSDWAKARQTIMIGRLPSLTGSFVVFRAQFVLDVNLTTVLSIVNKLFETDSSRNSEHYNSKLLFLIQEILVGETGIIDKIDYIGQSIQGQLSRLHIKGNTSTQEVPIRNEDPYMNAGKRANYNKYVQELNKTLKSGTEYRFRKILLLLIFQEVPFDLNQGRMLQAFILFIKVFVDDEGVVDDFIEMILRYQKWERELKLPYDLKILGERPFTPDCNPNDNEKPSPPELGSLQYFAMNSHSLSHRAFYPVVEKALRKSFITPKNPGYKEDQ